MYLFLDNETGGIGTEYSLLTTYLVILNDSFEKISDLYLYLKPDDGVYRVCGRAMGINKINLAKHDEIALTYKEGGTQLYNFLKNATDDGKIKLTVCGHGIHGDVEMILHYLMSRGSFEKFTSYRKLDTQGVVQFLKTCGIFKDEITGSLSSMATFFGINVQSESLHDAKYDTELTVEVFKKLRERIVDMDMTSHLYYIQTPNI